MGLTAVTYEVSGKPQSSSNGRVQSPTIRIQIYGL